MNEQNESSKPSKPAADITYRWLIADDDIYLDAVETTVRAMGWTPLPDRSLLDRTYRVFGAFVYTDTHQNLLVGFLIVQLIPHTEPLYVTPRYRGSDIARELSSHVFSYMLQSSTRGFMVVADNPIAVQLCEQLGLRKVDSPVYIGG